MSTSAEQIADALDCFWNASIGAGRDYQDSTASAVLAGMAQGFAAVAQRLREHAPAPLPAAHGDGGLLPCPFCGRPVLVQLGDTDFVLCGQRDDGSDGCGAVVSFRTSGPFRDVHKAFNRRAPAPEQPAAQADGGKGFAHACPEWDYLTIKPGSPEMDACRCDEAVLRAASACSGNAKTLDGAEAVRQAWAAAITLGNNICVQESDRVNAEDGDTGWIDGTSECAKRIRQFHRPDDAALIEMLTEAGAGSALAALQQRHPADADRVDAYSIECHGLDTPERVCFYEQDFYVLSNFSSFSLYWDATENMRFDTSEAAYHWEKFHGHEDIQFEIINAPSAHEAFKIAERNKGHRRSDWDDVKVDIMRDILRAKAAQHEYVRRKLLATGDRELVENSWRDDFWGWGPNRDGKNMLGKLWMEVRAELRAIDAARAEGR